MIQLLYLIVIFSLTASLSAQRIYITSNAVSCQRHNNITRVSHYGAVHVRGASLGQLHCTHLDLFTHDNQNKRVIARDVTLTKKNSTLTAQRLVFTPATHTAQASGSVILTTALPHGQHIRTHAPFALLHFADHRLHCWTTNNSPVTTKITYEQHHSSSQPRASTKNRSW